MRSEYRRSQGLEGERRRRRQIVGAFVQNALRQICKELLARASLSDAVAWRPGLFGPSMGLTPPRYALRGQALGCPNLFQTNLSNPRRFVHHLSSPQIRKKPLAGLLAYLAEREGFEPSIRLLTLYSLSRGAPSASRASLRFLSASLRSRQAY